MSWTKEEEIKMLRTFCQKLGDRNNSYCGEWLTAELANLERAIMDDVPAQCYAKTYREAEAIRYQLVKEGQDKLAAADKRSLEMVEAARKCVADLLRDAEDRKTELNEKCLRAQSHIASARQALVA